MFVPQVGKTLFNQGTLILIIHVSFAIWCPHFETEETENKHGGPGKENMDKFTLLYLSVWVCFLPAGTHRAASSPHSQPR